ncbi:hypothetical protein D3C86_1762020 [compost metagenome]
MQYRFAIDLVCVQYGGILVADLYCLAGCGGLIFPGSHRAAVGGVGTGGIYIRGIQPELQAIGYR